MFFFGTKSYTKDYGPIYSDHCPSCGVKTWIHLKRIRQWITFYFVLPVFPLGSRYALSCTICTAAWAIDHKQFKEYKAMVTNEKS